MNNTNNKGILRQLVPLLVVSGVFLSSCSLTGGSSVDGGSSSPSSYDSTATDSTNDVPYTSAGDSVTSGDYTSEEGDVSISLSDGASNSSGSGVSIDNANNLITISSLGTYVISGSLSNGSIYVNASKIDDDNDTVELVLNGASITSKGNASVVVSNVTVALGPIYSSSSSKLHIKCASGSTNVIVDSRASSSTVGDDSAAIFSNKLLRIKGSGSLKVTSTFNNGLASDTKVKAAKATCSVSAPNNAIKAHEAVVLGGYEDQGSF
ncbi:MAG: carbohydrate-binding domain-containing protein, partial [Bacilli bacterium]|nr:carbohydrate-binding domain-containing protein [Bacilli bacterium]